MYISRMFPRLIASSFVAFLAGWPAYGQTTVGVQKFGTYDGSPDTVDVGSLGLQLEIPLWGKAGRGRGTDWTIVLTNYSQYVPNPPCSQTSDGVYHCEVYGLSVAPGLLSTGTLITHPHANSCRNMPGSGTFTDTYYEYVDGQGNMHLFSGYSQTVADQNNTCSGISAFGITAGPAADGSGYIINVPSPPTFGPPTITTPGGTVYSNFSPYNTGASSLVDSNGNTISVPSACAAGAMPCLLTDTLNTSSVHVSGGTMASNYQSRQPIVISYLDDTGTSQTISLNYKLYTLSSSVPTDGLLLDNITYADGSAYHFTYVQNSSGTVLASPDGLSPVLLASIILPSSGTISYTYSWGTTACGSNPSWNYLASLSRTTSDGTTTYSRTITSQATTACVVTSWTKVTKPNGDQVFAYFVVPQQLALNPNSTSPNPSPTWQYDSKTFETKRVVYDHSNLSTPLRTMMRCYNGATGDCTSAAVNEPVTQLAVTTTLDNGLSSKIVTQYSGSLPTEVDEYDYGASSPNRKTVTSYASLGNNISDRPTSIIVYDAGGNVAMKTTYAYDETTPPPMTLPGHTTISGSRGNTTSVYKWIVSSNQSLRTQYTYDDAGQIIASTDPKLNTTSYAYDSTTDAYLTKITRPTTNSVAHVSTLGYGPNSGHVTSAYDENNQLTSFVYDAMFRPSSITYPDGGQTTFSYTPHSRTTNILQQSGVWNTNSESYDGYGRISSTDFVSDPVHPDFTATTYDSLGRVASVYNPTRCSPATTNCGEPTWGVTSYQYDALNRTTKITQPDGNTLLISYTGRATQLQDEGNGSTRVTRITQTDGLGRLTSVCEVAGGPFVGTGGSSSSSLIGAGGTPSSCGQDISATGFLTTYNYDPLNNLTQVNQSGVGPRRFTYDSLSRMTSVTNPESGAICYGTYSGNVCQGNGYDADGNLVTRIDARGTATTFGYDPLNRLTSKSYSDGTPGVTNTYDVAVDGLSILNPIGRLIKTATTDGKTASVNSYDQVGRIKNQWQCTPQNCGGTYFSIPYGYDLMGHTTSAGNGMGVTIGYGFNTAAQLTGVTSSLSDGTHPASLLSNATYNPFGAVASTTLGNGATESFSYDSRARLQNVSTNGATGSTGSVTLSGSEQSIPGAPATAGSGSVTFNGTLQSKQVQTQAAASGTGTITISGSEENIPTNPAAPGSGSTTISGTEGTVTYCSAINQRTGNCIRWTTAPDTGTVWVSVNGSTASVSYGASSNPTNLATALVNAVNTTTGIDTTVSATASGATVYLTARSVGASTNYSLSAGSSSTYGGSSFANTVSGSTLTGGHDTVPAVYDSGKVSVVVNGSPVSYSYGQNDTASSIASALAASLNSSSPYVSASANGSVIAMTAKTTGSATNYPLSTSVSYDTTHFSNASFSASLPGSTLTGGRDAAYNTIYDSGTSTVTVNNHGTSYSWSGSSTTASSIASGLAANINADSAASVTASSSGSTVNLTAKTAGANTSSYSLGSSSTYDSADFSSGSFTSSNSGSTLTGGHDAGATTYDAGSVWITVNGTQYSTTYGQGSTGTSLASSLAQTINSSSASPVTATVSSTTVSLASKEGGSSTNYSLAVGSQTTQGASFSQPSFSASASGSAMTGGGTGNLANIYSLALGYAPNGDISNANDSVNGNWVYAYDPFNRLVSANQNSGQSVYNYVYDIAGNRWQQNGPYSMTLSFTGNNSTNNNRADGYSYDAAGNLNADGTYCYSYDAEDRITQVTLPPCGSGSVIATYAYDANGHRVERNAGSYHFEHIYDLAGNVVAEYCSPCSWGTGWNRGEVYVGARHLATYANSTTYFNHIDWLSTERLRTSLGASSCETMTSLPFGDHLSVSGSCADINPMHFTGQEHDSESGLDNFVARHLTSNMGRFMSPDPANAGATLDVPQSWNAYSYVLNNPLKYVDPSGMDCIYVKDTDDGPKVDWIKPGDCTSETDNGYYVDSKVGTVTSQDVSFTSDGNVMLISFGSETDVPGLGHLETKCVGDCPGFTTTVVGLSDPIQPTMSAWRPDPTYLKKYEPPVQSSFDFWHPTAEQKARMNACVATGGDYGGEPIEPPEVRQAVAQVHVVDENGKGEPAKYGGNNKPVIPNIQGAKKTPKVTGLGGFLELYVGATRCIENIATPNK